MLGQAVCSILLSNQNKKPMETREPNELKGQLSFSKVKILWWFTTIGYTLQSTLQDYTLCYKLASAFTRTPLKLVFITFCNSPITL